MLRAAEIISLKQISVTASVLGEFPPIQSEKEPSMS